MFSYPEAGKLREVGDALHDGLTAAGERFRISQNRKQLIDDVRDLAYGLSPDGFDSFGNTCWKPFARGIIRTTFWWQTGGQYTVLRMNWDGITAPDFILAD